MRSGPRKRRDRRVLERRTFASAMSAASAERFSPATGAASSFTASGGAAFSFSASFSTSSDAGGSAAGCPRDQRERQAGRGERPGPMTKRGEAKRSLPRGSRGPANESHLGIRRRVSGGRRRRLLLGWRGRDGGGVVVSGDGHGYGVFGITPCECCQVVIVSRRRGVKRCQ